MNLPASRPDPDAIRITDSSRFDDFAALAGALRELAGATLVYAPSTTTITNTGPVASPGPAPVEVRLSAPAGPVVQSATQPVQLRARFTLGEVVAYSGATLMGGAVFTGLVSVLLTVPMLVPLLAGSVALLGMLAAMAGAALDSREREGAGR